MPVYWTGERVNAPQNTRNKLQRLRVSIPKHQRKSSANFRRGLSVCNGSVRSAHSVRKCNGLTWRSRMFDNHPNEVKLSKDYLSAKNVIVWPTEYEFPKSLNVGLQNSLWWTNFKSSLQTSPWSCTKSIIFSDDENQEICGHGPPVILDENEFLRPSTTVVTRKRTSRWDEPESCRLSKSKRKKKNSARQWRTIHLLGDYWSDSELPEWSTSEDELDSSEQQSCKSFSNIFTWSNLEFLANSGKNESMGTINQLIEDDQTSDELVWNPESVYPQVHELNYILALCNDTMESREEKSGLAAIPGFVNNEVQRVNERLGGLENEDCLWQLQEDILQLLTDSIYSLGDIDPWSLCLPKEVNPPMAIRQWQPCPTIFSFEKIRMSYECLEETLGSGIMKYCLSQISAMTSKLRWILDETLQLLPLGRDKELPIHLKPRSNCLELTEIGKSKIPSYIEHSELKQNIIVPYNPAINTVKKHRGLSWSSQDDYPCTLKSNILNKYHGTTPNLLNRGSWSDVQTTNHLVAKSQAEWQNSFYPSENKAQAWNTKNCSAFGSFKQRFQDLLIPEVRTSKAICFNDTNQITSNHALNDRDIELWPDEWLLIVANMISSYASTLWLLTEMNTPGNAVITSAESVNFQLPCPAYPQYLASKQNSIITLPNSWSNLTLVSNELLVEPTLSNCIEQNAKFAGAITQNHVVAKWQCNGEQPNDELDFLGFGLAIRCVPETNQMKSLLGVNLLNSILPEEILCSDAEISDDPLSTATDKDDVDLDSWTFLNDTEFFELEENFLDEHDWILVDAESEAVQ